uniref:Cytochrome b6/f complex subunit IV n=1 Tax=Chenopodium album TaxID=3559 RepID=A0A291S813_CHEAL|nr:cytochrome b6/f complex subunit IV [Chenopodium album]
MSGSFGGIESRKEFTYPNNKKTLESCIKGISERHGALLRGARMASFIYFSCSNFRYYCVRRLGSFRTINDWAGGSICNPFGNITMVFFSCISNTSYSTKVIRRSFNGFSTRGIINRSFFRKCIPKSISASSSYNCLFGWYRSSPLAGYWSNITYIPNFRSFY